MNIQDVITEFNNEHKRVLGGHTVVGSFKYNLTHFGGEYADLGNFGSVNAKRLEELSELGRMYCINSVTFDIFIKQTGDESLKFLAIISGKNNFSLITGKSFKKIRGCFFRFVAKKIKSTGPILVPGVYSGCGTKKIKEYQIEKNGKSRWSRVINETAPFSISAERWVFEHIYSKNNNGESYTQVPPFEEVVLSENSFKTWNHALYFKAERRTTQFKN